MFRLALFTVLAVAINWATAQIEDKDVFCAKLFPGKDLYNAQIDQTNKCLIYCRVPEKYDVYRPEGDQCDAVGTVNSYCFNSKCTERDTKDYQECQKLGADTFNFAQRADQCRINCYKLPNKSPIVVDATGACSSGERIGVCSNGKCNA